MHSRRSRILAVIAAGFVSLLGVSGTAHAQSGVQASGLPGIAAPLADSGPWHIVNRHSGKCLTIQGASTGQNARAVQFSCDGTAPFNENWMLDDVRTTDNNYHLVNQHSNRCLTIQGASQADNAFALQFTCDTTEPFNEEWFFLDLRPGDDNYHIVNRHSNKCLTVQGASLANNAFVLQFGCDSAAPFNEEWQLVAP